MKTRNLLFIIVKIIGLIAFWKAVQSFGAVISGIGIFSSQMAHNNQMHGSFMMAMGLAMTLNFVLPLLLALLFLFRTEKVLALLKLEEQSDIHFKVNKLVLYHVFILAFGILVLMHGAGNFLKYDYKMDTKTEITTNNDLTATQGGNVTKHHKTSTTNSKNKSVNYFAFIEIILGVVMLAKSTELATRIEKNFDSNTKQPIT
jgi:uncharacterized membrane protein YidH (DUF202 family)